MSSFKALITLLSIGVISAMAEMHTVVFTNKCGHGTPTLVQDGRILSTGATFTINGPLIGAIAYLQTGNCGLNGEGCTIIEITLENPTTPGSGSSTDISLIPPHSFSVASGFEYLTGCEGVNGDCKNANCVIAFRNPNDTRAQGECQADNVRLSPAWYI